MSKKLIYFHSKTFLKKVFIVSIYRNDFKNENKNLQSDQNICAHRPLQWIIVYFVYINESGENCFISQQTLISLQLS